LLVLATVGAAAVSYLISTQLPKLYESTAMLRLDAGLGNGSASTYDQILGMDRLPRTYAEVLKSHQVVEPAIRQAGFNLSYEAAQDLVDVKPLPNTYILQVTARAPEPEMAARFANELSTTFISRLQADQVGQYAATLDLLNKQFEQLSADLADRRLRASALRAQSAGTEHDNELARIQIEIDQLQAGSQALVHNYELLWGAQARNGPSVVVLDPATPRMAPVQPRVTQNVVLAAITGLLIAAGVAFVVEYFDDRLSSADRVARFTGLEVLGSAGNYRSAPDAAPLTEAFRLLHAKLQFAAMAHPLRALAITSCSVGDGKTTIAANLAMVAAQAGFKVLLVDGDLRRPALHAVLGLPNGTGLTSMLENDQLAAADTVQPTSVPGLSLVASGPLPPSPGQLLASQRMRLRLAELRELADLVVIDMSAVLPVSDPSVLAGLVDGVLLVVNAGRTRGQQAAPAVAMLHGAGARLLGVVLNRVPRGGGSYTTYSTEPRAYESEPLPSIG
jgi:succinoglycan biosynthesis transport protein ExoP